MKHLKTGVDKLDKSLKKLKQIYPTWKESDLETLDKVITDRELEELIEAHGLNE